ncbi:MAG TPA: VOC family protein, partial [Polyangiaceae bacterium]|nr:VOC family protein [Polyangiaceae bacterium]
ESIIYQVGSCRFVCTAPRRDGSAAARYLRRHPEGIGRVTLAVEDLARSRHELERRGGTFVSDQRAGSEDLLELATPVDDLDLCFVQRPGVSDSRSPQRTATGLSHVDHVTINTATILPLTLWFRHLLGLEPYWEIEFHTSDARAREQTGSGLKSVALRDPHSEIRFALNEPRRPNFLASQIELFRQDHRGSGVQHVAIHVDRITDVVGSLRARGVRFAPTPQTYYEQLPARLERVGVGPIGESLATLRELGILVDGSGRGRYLLQIFMEDDAAFLGGRDRSPFFLELIERKGCPEFGAGNFRALFESIEAAQSARVTAP